MVASIEQDTVARLATVRLLPPGQPEDEIIADLLFASSGIERAVADAADWELARGAVDLIAARGYARGRDLPAALAQLVRS